MTLEELEEHAEHMSKGELIELLLETRSLLDEALSIINPNYRRSDHVFETFH